MPIVFEDTDEVQSTPTGLAIPGPKPESIRSEAQRLFTEAKAGLEKDFPGIEFGRRKKVGEPVPDATAKVAEGEDFVIGGTDYKEPPPAPPPPPPPEEDKPGWFSSVGRAIAERTGAVTANMVVDPANAIGDLVPDWLDSGLVIDKEGIRFESGDKYADKSVAKFLEYAGDNVDYGGAKNLTQTDEIKAAWNAGDKGKAARLGIKFGVEQGIVSLPDMVAIVARMPQYTLGLAADYARERAQNDGRETINPADAVAGSVTALMVAGLERYGADKVFDRIGGKEAKSKLRKWLESILAETATEAVQNPLEFAGTRLGTQSAGQVTGGALAEQAGFGALGGAGGGAVIGGAAQLVGGREQPPAQTPPPPAGPAQPPPTQAGAPPAPPPGPAQPPPAAPAAPGAAPAATAPPVKAGEPAVWKPSPTTPGTAVMVLAVDPKTGYATVVQLDENGEPKTDEDGQPVAFQAQLTEFPAPVEAQAPAQPAPSPVAPAAPQGGPPPSAVPPAATSTEPTLDIAGQVRDMYRAQSKRRGVYVSPATVAKMQQEGTYQNLLKVGVVEENFDGQGGVLIVKSKKDLEEAKAARDGGQADMQAIVGGLTGAGVAKPNVPNPAVVQRKDETGAVVQQTAVPQEQAAATAAAVAQQPGTVETVTPEQALAEREQKVAQEVQDPYALTTPDRTLGEAAKALGFVTTQLDTPAPGKLTKPDVRGVAGFIGAAGATLRAAAAAAKARGAPDELIAAAAKAAQMVAKFENKSEKDFFKGRGVSERILRERADAIGAALKGLVDWHNANPNATAQAPAPKPAAPAKKPSAAEKVKQVSKAKEAPVRQERRVNAELRAKVEAMTPEERTKALMTHDLTGLPNRRAMEGVEAPAWAEVDADSLKWVNDNMGEEAGNQLLKNVAEALSSQDGIEAYHISGDEFYVSGASEAEIETALKAAAEQLKDMPVTAGRNVMMPQITWGTGKTREAASKGMKKQKVAREMKGKRAPRGEKPGTVKDTAQTELQLEQEAASAPPPAPAAEEAPVNIEMVPKEFRTPGEFFFHQVRNTEDVASIVANGLLPGSNVSMVDGQAIEMWDGGVVLVFENDGSLKAKGYQKDSLTTKPAKPIAILVDTTYAEKPASNQSAALDALADQYEKLEKETEAFLEAIGLDREGWVQVQAAFPKGEAYQSLRASLPTARATKLSELVRKHESLGNQIVEESEKPAGTSPAVTTVDVLGSWTQYGLPVYAQTGVSLMPEMKSAVGVTVAPTGETKMGRKKKYVPPKKRIEQEAKAAEKQVDTEAAPPSVEVLPLAASNVAVADVPRIASELIGLTPTDLAAEAEADTSGQLMSILGLLMENVRTKDNWMGWYTAVMRGDVLKDQKNTLKGLIRRYVAAQDSEIPGVWEEMLGLMTNVEGKMLPPQAITAIREAANVARAYNEIVETLRSDPDSEFNEFLPSAEEDTEAVKAGLKKDQPGGATMSVVDPGEMGTTATKPADSPSYASVARELVATAKTSAFRNGVRELVGLLKKDGRLTKLVTQQMTGAQIVSTAGIADTIIEVAANSSNPDVRAVGHLVSRIRRYAPDLPVEFIRDGDPMVDTRGKKGGWNSGGRLLPEGLMQLRLGTTDTGSPSLLDGWLVQAFVHEYTHAATLYELRAHPDGPLAKRLDAIRMKLIAGAIGKFGREAVSEVLDYYQKGFNTKTPPSNLTNELGEFLYALTNNLELTAETFSNPQFHEFVRSLGPPRKWYRTEFVNKFVKAMARLLGVAGSPKQQDLLNELVTLTDRVMQAQYARTLRAQTVLANVAQILETVMGLDPKAALAAATEIQGMHNPVTLDKRMQSMAPGRKFDPYKFAMGVTGQKDNPSQMLYDKLAVSAYGWSPEGLADRIAQSRANPKNAPDAYIFSPDFRRLRDASTPALATASMSMKKLMGSGIVGKIRRGVKGLPTMDYVVRRGARFFGAENDPSNPLVQWKTLRDRRRSYSNQLAELAERTVNSKWTKLNAKQSEEIGDVLQESTLWQIDPRLDVNQPRPKAFGKRAWEAKHAELQQKWAQLTPEQQDIYASVQKYFQQEYARIRRAAVDMAVDMYGSQLNQLQKTLLYGIRNIEAVDRLVGTGKPVDLGEANERFASTLKEVIRVSSIKGPYFPLFRDGDFVVEADREGALPTTFADKAEAEEAAAEIRSLSPKNKAKVVDTGAGYTVTYKVREVSFHKTENEAQAALEDLQARGLAPKDGVYTAKLSDIGASSMTESLKELQNHATKLAGDSESATLVAQTIQQAFLELLAQKAASASSQLQRQGVAGFKGNEAHLTFATRVRASSWHYANLKTALAQSKALQRLNAASKDATLPVPSNMTVQQAVMERGRVVNEIRHRLTVEAAELDALDRSANKWGQYAGMLGFVNFLATPSYAFVNSMQNFNVALPVVSAKYGAKGAKSMMRAMKVVIGPTMARAMRGVFSKPGNVTSYDVYTAIAAALKDHPRYGKYVQGEDSAMQQLVDLGVINASFVQELSAVANNRNIYVNSGLEYLRLFPQGMELWNRISTALAVLDVTNGNVNKAADMVNQVHFDYTLENRPRYFRSVMGFRMPQAITMFKMYGVGMYQLTGSLLVDAVSRRGQSRADRARAATALAGVIASHTVAAGVMGGIMVEPLRALIYLFNSLFGDDDEFKDIDTMVQRWAAGVSENERVRRMLAKGVWAGLGFDLSSRMGLDRVMIFNPPEGTGEDKWWKFFGRLAGPLPSMVIEKSVRSAEYLEQGKVAQAMMELVPVKLFQDARKAWKLMTEGVTTKKGATIAGPEEFNWIDAVGTAAGFRTTEAAKLSDMASTEFTYKGWRKARASTLVGAYTRAMRAGDQAAKDKALADIMEFNRKNPKDPITGRSIGQSFRSQESAARDRRGEGRNQALQEILDY